MNINNKDFNDLYEKLSELFEDAEMTPDKKEAANKFWASLKTDVIDTDSFHKAYDDDLPDEFRKNFDDYNGGILMHRGTYGDIKNLDQTAPATKALKRLWAAQFVDGKKSQAQIDHDKKWAEEAAARQKEREEEERRKKEAEEKRVKETNETFQNALDKDLINKVIQLSNDPADIMPYYDGRYFQLAKNTITTAKDPISAAKHCNDYYQQRLEELEAEDMYKNNDWYKPLMDWYEKECRKFTSSTYTYIYFQDKKGQMYEMEVIRNRYSGPEKDFMARLKNMGAPADVDMTAVKVVLEEGNGGSTYKNSYSTTFVSLSYKASEQVVDKLGIEQSVDPSAPGYTFWGHVENWQSVPKDKAERTAYYYIDGMDMWYTNKVTYYSTD